MPSGAVKRDQRLRKSADFQRVRDLDRRGRAHPLVVVYMAPNDHGSTRVGITVSRRVGGAVTRNRVRRRLRELLTACFDQLPCASDVVVTARPGAASASWAELSAAVETLIKGR